jgi:hypothetical protein
VDWVKLATRYYTDPKVRGLDDAAELMFVRGLARAGELGDGGFIPESDVSLLARRRRCETLVRQLVVARLWSRVDGGYRIIAWADWQSAADALAARRTADRERQRRRRAVDRPRENLSRDNGNLSRDVTATEGELERDLPGGSAKTHEGVSRDEPPPNRCEKHTNTRNPPSCGGCADARKALNRWEAARAKRVAASPQCPLHRGELADNCRICRAEELNPA